MPKTIGEVARLIDVMPSKISGLLYSRKLDVKLCPVSSGRRLIPDSYIPTIVKVLRENGVRCRSVSEAAK